MTGNVRTTLEAMDFHPSRKLGQNFLTDPNMAAWIVDQLDPQARDCVIEVGPGLGALTRHLAGRVGRLVLVEKDYRLADRLKREFADNPTVEVHAIDACDFDVRLLYQEKVVKFVGNLPYSAAGEIMRRLLDAPTPVTLAVLMIQKEVAERLVARPGTKNFGVLTLQHAQRWQVEKLKLVPPQLFFPVPAIDSAVVRFAPLAPGFLPVFDRRRFTQLIKMGFSQRRKQLRKLLPDSPHTDWTELAEGLGFSPSCRAEELDLDQWIALTRQYGNGLGEGGGEASSSAGHDDVGQRADEVFDVVDDEDKVVRQETRGKVHAEGLTHRAVHIFAFNRQGELFLQKRSHLKDTMPLRWDSSAAGHLDAGESYAAAAVREVEEELGIAGAELTWVAILPPSEANGYEFIQVYETTIKPSKIRLPAAEVDCGEFFSLESVEEWIEASPEDFAPGFLQCFVAYSSRK